MARHDDESQVTLTIIHDVVKEIRSELKSTNLMVANLADKMLEFERRIDILYAAMPPPEKGGMVGHRLDHERRHDSCQEKKATRISVKAGIWLAVIVGAALWSLGAAWDKVVALFRAHP